MELPTHRKQSYMEKRPCYVKDVVHKPPTDLWNVITMFVRAGKFINDPANLPTVPLNTT